LPDVVGGMLSFSFYEGLVFGLVAIGVYLTLRVLAFPDLTVDGSYTLGGAVAAVENLLKIRCCLDVERKQQKRLSLISPLCPSFALFASAVGQDLGWFASAQ